MFLDTKTHTSRCEIKLHLSKLIAKKVKNNHTKNILTLQNVEDTHGNIWLEG